MDDPESARGALKVHASRLKQLSSGAPVRVLIVDDQESVVEFVKRVLDEAGYVTTTASSGAAALHAFTEGGAPDLLLTDLKMPGMDGDELVARLRYSSPDLKVLYLTGFSSDLFKRRAALWKNEAFLEKPCTVRGLLEAVAMVLYGRLMPETGSGRSGHRERL